MSAVVTANQCTRMLAVVDPDTVHNEPRRSEEREDAPAAFWYVCDAGIIHSLQFEIEMDRKTYWRAVPAVALNCSSGGICMLSTARAQVGEAVHITASDASSQMLLFCETYQICSRRQAGQAEMTSRGSTAVNHDTAATRIPGNPVYRGFEEESSTFRPEYLYGLRRTQGGYSLVFKSCLDSLLLEFLQYKTDSIL